MYPRIIFRQGGGSLEGGSTGKRLCGLCSDRGPPSDVRRPVLCQCGREKVYDPGEEWVVRQVSVELLEKNEKYAAVEGISSEQEVVTESSRTLEEGSRVKVNHEMD